MIKLNNKGQSLFLFVIFIPIFLMICVFVVDIGFAKIEENKLNNISILSLNYGLSHIEDDPYDEMVNLINKNDSKIDNYSIDIDLENKKINIMLEKNIDSFFGGIINKDKYDILSNYTGYIDTDGNRKIERVLSK